MKSIYELQREASRLRAKTEADSISPEDTFGLHADTLAYMADMEQNAKALGIRKVYKSKEDMEADTEPVGTNGKALRYGQLVSIFDAENVTSAENGNIYAWQAPGWLLSGNTGNVYDLEAKIKAEKDARTAADDVLANKLAEETNSRETGDSELATRLYVEKAERMTAIGEMDGKIRLLSEGTTARFSGFLPDAEIGEVAVSGDEVSGIYFVRSHGTFAAAYTGNEGVGYTYDWPTSANYMTDDRIPLKDKVYLCGGNAYVWNHEGSSLSEVGEGAHKDMQDSISSAQEIADKAIQRTSGTAVLPFSGIYPSRPGALPPKVPGVYFRSGYFYFHDLDGRKYFGYTTEDYNDTAEDGTLTAREDAIFRRGTRLYRFVGGELHDLMLEKKTEEELDALVESGGGEEGVIYYSVED